MKLTMMILLVLLSLSGLVELLVSAQGDKPAVPYTFSMQVGRHHYSYKTQAGNEHGKFSGVLSIDASTIFSVDKQGKTVYLKPGWSEEGATACAEAIREVALHGTNPPTPDYMKSRWTTSRFAKEAKQMTKKCK